MKEVSGATMSQKEAVEYLNRAGRLHRLLKEGAHETKRVYRGRGLDQGAGQ